MHAWPHHHIMCGHSQKSLKIKNAAASKIQFQSKTSSSRLMDEKGSGAVIPMHSLE
jgi:hypothetical protein